MSATSSALARPSMPSVFVSRRVLVVVRGLVLGLLVATMDITSAFDWTMLALATIVLVKVGAKLSPR